MHKKVLTLACILLWLSSCSNYGGIVSERSRRATQLGDVEPAVTVAEQAPEIILDQEVKNCVDNPLCKLEASVSQTGALQINSLIVAEADILNTQNMNDAPTIRFTVNNIDVANISSITYKYIKKDALGNIQIQTEEKTLGANNEYYNIPIHISTLGIGIANSAPYDKHYLGINIRTASNKSYSYEITFSLLSSCENPVLMSRRNEIMDSAYYKMDQDLNDFTIDSLDVVNTLAYAVKVSGSININNSTVAILSNTHRAQQKTFVPKPSNYPWDQYEMTTSTYNTYHQSTVAPNFSILVTRNSGITEELQATINNNLGVVTLSFSDLSLQGNEQIKLDLIMHTDINNSIIGAHGEEQFFEGMTRCDNVTNTSKCSCFYYTPDLHVQDMAMYSILACGAVMNPYSTMYYPNCGAPENSYCLQKFLDIVTYPENLLNLVGRHHRTNTSYTITSWLAGYESYDELGTSTRTMDAIEVIKGTVDYGSIDNSLSYSGYIPGSVTE